MTSSPFISVCIPAYKRVEYLERLLKSISEQTFKDFEVVITDDSNDESVANFLENYYASFPVVYSKNAVALGSPENWNAAIRLAKGQWIKMMHHDDWFSSRKALEIFAEKIKKEPGKNFFFCSYENIYEDGKTKKITPPNTFLRKLILKDPAALLSDNIIGPPSVTIYKNDKTIFYDSNLQWLVDLEFYIRYLKNTQPFYIDQSLINIGIHKEQVTKYSFLKPEIEIPEHLHVLNKLGVDCLENIIVYDAFWRLVRNLKIRSLQQFSGYNKDNIQIPDKLIKIIKHQTYLPAALLAIGLFSKIAMLLSYLRNRSQ
jgi:glycosyltransferase involved in cell wall biosynthesis